jgi:uncharacterized protein YigE (DUF2233 family)
MRAFRTALFFLCFLILAGADPSCAAHAGQAPQAVAWNKLEQGLDLAKIPLALVISPAPEESAQEQVITLTTTVSVLRIDPALFSFSLYMASEKGRKNMANVCKDENFVAATNTGMFLPDKMTSTGYLRQGPHANNNRIAANFGSFFVAGPVTAKLPQARLIDRNIHRWQKAIAEYSLVMQNYRMTTPTGRVIWKQAERLHSISALSQDAQGNILFIFCPDPVPASDFMAALLAHPLGASSVMYLEGGSEAALIINSGDISEMQTGRHASGLWSSGAKLEIPNVLGVKRRTKKGPM